MCGVARQVLYEAGEAHMTAHLHRVRSRSELR